jgi:hypothetical protein
MYGATSKLDAPRTSPYVNKEINVEFEWIVQNGKWQNKQNVLHDNQLIHLHAKVGFALARSLVT